jgi:hypothetical protein
MDNNTPYDESENPSPGQDTYNNRIDVLVARIEDHITLLLEGISIDELSAYEREQLATKYCGLLVRLLTLGVKVEDDQPEGLLSLTLPIMGKDDEAESRFKTIDLSNYSLMGERKITPGKPTPRERLVLWVDEDWEDEDEESIG